MINLIKKIFCLHKWESHAKSEYEWEETNMIKGTEGWFRPKWSVSNYSKTVEVLTCKNCGKVKKIEY